MDAPPKEADCELIAQRFVRGEHDTCNAGSQSGGRTHQEAKDRLQAEHDYHTNL